MPCSDSEMSMHKNYKHNIVSFITNVLLCTRVCFSLRKSKIFATLAFSNTLSKNNIDFLHSTHSLPK